MRTTEEVARAVLHPFLMHIFSSPSRALEWVTEMIRERDSEVRADERAKVPAEINGKPTP